ncbi:UNKNOWN [Stylonychia lemnae]|uniref:Uncharacterized protein n=1 Tax=Stylonychia lemnae TaxID=5949 RepID=A0A078A973_STYLE|nr:UNKNOWN [Stylonychia lemnae]|eukprot:CDW78391.1 UNKNOWN [Stylonychia lemnae]
MDKFNGFITPSQNNYIESQNSDQLKQNLYSDEYYERQTPIQNKPNSVIINYQQNQPFSQRGSNKSQKHPTSHHKSQSTIYNNNSQNLLNQNQQQQYVLYSNSNNSQIDSQVYFSDKKKARQNANSSVKIHEQSSHSSLQAANQMIDFQFNNVHELPPPPAHKSQYLQQQQQQMQQKQTHKQLNGPLQTDRFKKQMSHRQLSSQNQVSSLSSLKGVHEFQSIDPKNQLGMQQKQDNNSFLQDAMKREIRNIVTYIQQIEEKLQNLEQQNTQLIENNNKLCQFENEAYIKFEEYDQKIINLEQSMVQFMEQSFFQNIYEQTTNNNQQLNKMQNNDQDQLGKYGNNQFYSFQDKNFGQGVFRQDTPTISCCSSEMGDTIDKKQNMRDFLDETMKSKQDGLKIKETDDDENYYESHRAQVKKLPQSPVSKTFDIPLQIQNQAKIVIGNGVNPHHHSNRQQHHTVQNEVNRSGVDYYLSRQNNQMKSKAYLDVRALIQTQMDSQPIGDSDILNTNMIRKSQDKSVHNSSRNENFKHPTDAQKAMQSTISDHVIEEENQESERTIKEQSKQLNIQSVKSIRSLHSGREIINGREVDRMLERNSHLSIDSKFKSQERHSHENNGRMSQQPHGYNSIVNLKSLDMNLNEEALMNSALSQGRDAKYVSSFSKNHHASLSNTQSQKQFEMRRVNEKFNNPLSQSQSNSNTYELKNNKFQNFSPYESQYLQINKQQIIEDLHSQQEEDSNQQSMTQQDTTIKQYEELNGTQEIQDQNFIGTYQSKLPMTMHSQLSANQKTRNLQHNSALIMPDKELQCFAILNMLKDDSEEGVKFAVNGSWLLEYCILIDLDINFFVNQGEQNLSQKLNDISLIMNRLSQRLALNQDFDVRLKNSKLLETQNSMDYSKDVEPQDQHINTIINNALLLDEEGNFKEDNQLYQDYFIISQIIWNQFMNWGFECDIEIQLY